MKQGSNMKLTFIIIVLAIAGCSSVRLNSNADTYLVNQIENHMRKNAVKRYTYNEVWKLGAAQVGYVESDYCQLDFRDHKIDQNTLISSLEIKTQKLGGNALVFDSCLVNSNMASCHIYTKCKGMAYNISY
jgi:hypothetical protein